MKKASSESPKIHGSRSGAISNAVVTDSTTSPPNQAQNLNLNSNNAHNPNHDKGIAVNDDGLNEKSTAINGFIAPVKTTSSQLPAFESTQAERSGPVVEPPPKAEEQTTTTTSEPKKQGGLIDEIRRNARLAITYSWLNVLLVFVPIGIIVAEIDGIHGGIVFGMNAIAIIPLAGLLAFATESVALEMGDALGALLNVTFGNAVELIIFIALVKDEIRIVQASLLGSILANLLLILGMGFLLGGLRFREQIYNSTVTQMSACLLSLSVTSLVLPTAFHASFSDSKLADKQSLKISRGTSVILLLVYLVYLLFQLKSHAYMYESTPQHIVDAESTPGPAAAWLDASSSEDSSSSSSSSDDSDSSQGTMRKKMKKVLRSRRRRKSAASSTDSNAKASVNASFIAGRHDETASEASASRPKIPRYPSVESNEDAIADDESHRKHKRHHRRHKYLKNKKNALEDDKGHSRSKPGVTFDDSTRAGGEGVPRRVDFAVQNESQPNRPQETDSGAEGSGRRPFPALRGISVKNLTPTVFGQNPEVGIAPPVPQGPVPRVRYGIRRTNSLPDRLNQHQFRPPGAMLPAQIPLMTINSGVEPGTEDDADKHLSRAGSVVLLLVSTGLVALCAEFLVGSIQEVVATSSVGEIFIGLIILPIVGNAAEHVTAITVAMKNKMDLAIGVAVGSSIQIALFITPLVVILGWAMDREMTLYFTLFETVCLFVSAFIVNFLVLDGRSNYLEGALLCAVYLIISVVAFYYPDEDDASSWGA
ncbi:calcium/proton exchanger [Dactylonectria macrodidyma]|uniref:Calcium/proton exchanger n=1 Tax=Dactylonectria macrodidyma TaxID=307937 RepID=A0A9P9F7X6_9HYPO|nr:calcium/proton exchanger [Dactylonectria macrodidyma]